MNENVKKKLKIVGCVVGGLVGVGGLMYTGYLFGAGFYKLPFYSKLPWHFGWDKSTKPGMINLVVKPPLTPKGAAAFPFSKEVSMRIHEQLGQIIEEVK